MIRSQADSATMAFAQRPSATVPAEVQWSRFSGTGGVTEANLLVRPTEAAPFAAQLAWIDEAYRAALADAGLDNGTALWRRVFVSNLAHHAGTLATHPLTSRDAADEPCGVSWVEQPPTPPAELALWAYHVRDEGQALDKHRDGPTLAWTRNGRIHCWTSGVAASGGSSAYQQARAAFEHYAALLRRREMSLARDVVRTWLFVNDIDRDYAALSSARRAFFAVHGLCPGTHFIASTGIGGRGPDAAARLTLDALAIKGLAEDQVTYLTAPDHLCPTHVYGVTFERGTAITYRDRTHVLISGTASIDPQGRVLHVGDVTRQLDRTVENIAALLNGAGATARDLGVVLAYVRNPTDWTLVRDGLRAHYGDVPVEVVVGAVCRPEWLVEVEAWGAIAAERPDLPSF